MGNKSLSVLFAFFRLFMGLVASDGTRYSKCDHTVEMDS
jgi:hypothetical protein